jgi:hypothetical protein
MTLVWRQVDHLQQFILYLQIGSKGKEKKAAADFKAALKALQSSGMSKLLVRKGVHFTIDESHAKCPKESHCRVHLRKYVTSLQIALESYVTHNQNKLFEKNLRHNPLSLLQWLRRTLMQQRASLWMQHRL